MRSAMQHASAHARRKGAAVAVVQRLAPDSGGRGRIGTDSQATAGGGHVHGGAQAMACACTAERERAERKTTTGGGGAWVCEMDGPSVRDADLASEVWLRLWRADLH